MQALLKDINTLRTELLCKPWLLFLAPGTLLLLVYVYRIFLHPLRRIPGPFPAKFTELWRTTKYAKGNWHQDILDLHRQYGPVVRVSPNEISIVDKIGLTEVFGHGKGTRKTSWYDVWMIPGHNNSFFHSTNPAEHSFLRKRVASAYTMSTILSLEPEVQQIADAVWTKLDKYAQEGRPVNMSNWANYFAFDVVGKLALGSPIGFIEQEKDVMSIIRSIHAGFYQMASMGYVPGKMIWINNPVTQTILSIVQRIMQSGSSFNTFGKWNVDQLMKRLSEPEGAERKTDMLDHYIAMREPDGSKATVPSILAETGNIIGAGADTTSIGIRAVLAQLVLHPEDYLQVREEVDKAYAEGGFASGYSGIPYLVAEKLTFLNACVKEALRLHPSILWQLPRQAPANGVQIAGHYIPSSATISMSPIAQNRDTSVFGADADNWRPTRWMASKGSDPAQIREMDKFNVTFGYGARTCVGRNLALVEIHKFIADFVRRYDAQFMNKQRPFVVKSQWFSYQADMHLDLRLRKLS
ncbi:cytochrome P450 [Ilyonectria sp. MPI-CAGE-AT-0026]|nr:cytochrome P450 [Ilyonectria sp. MPI-CAGE-AT-0026]